MWVLESRVPDGEGGGRREAAGVSRMTADVRLGARHTWVLGSRVLDGEGGGRRPEGLGRRLTSDLACGARHTARRGPGVTSSGWRGRRAEGCGRRVEEGDAGLGGAGRPARGPAGAAGGRRVVGGAIFLTEGYLPETMDAWLTGVATQRSSRRSCPRT